MRVKPTPQDALIIMGQLARVIEHCATRAGGGDPVEVLNRASRDYLELRPWRDGRTGDQRTESELEQDALDSYYSRIAG